PSLVQAKALGDASDDLVYNPVTPCREVDTRVAGGALGTNQSRDFKVWVSSGGFTAQGGSATNCSIPANPVAVVVNIAAVSPAGGGEFIAPPPRPPKTPRARNYHSGAVCLSKRGLRPRWQPNCTNQLTIATNGAGAQVVIDIVGFFKPPGGSTVTGVTASAPLVSSGGTTPNISLTGSIPVAYGGTGQATLATNGIVYGQGT